MTRLPLTIAVFAMCVPLRIHADEATGKALAREAEELANRQQFVAAAAKFREAFAADATAEYLCNIGVAYHKAKTEQPRAHLFLTRCQERATVLKPKFVAAVNTALTTVDRDLRAGAFTPIEITVEPKTATVGISTFAADEVFIGPRAIWLPHGKHTIRFTAEGYVAKAVEVDASTRERQSIVISLDREAERPPDVVIVDAGAGAIEPDAGAGSGSAIITPPLPPPVEPAPKPSKIIPIATSVATLALVVTASLSYGRAQGRAEVAAFAISPEVFQADKDYITRNNQYTAITAGLAVVGASVSTFLWYRALREPRARIEVNASGTGASVSVGGRF